MCCPALRAGGRPLFSRAAIARRGAVRRCGAHIQPHFSLLARCGLVAGAPRAQARGAPRAQARGARRSIAVSRRGPSRKRARASTLPLRAT